MAQANRSTRPRPTPGRSQVTCRMASIAGETPRRNARRNALRCRPAPDSVRTAIPRPRTRCPGSGRKQRTPSVRRGKAAWIASRTAACGEKNDRLAWSAFMLTRISTGPRFGGLICISADGCRAFATQVTRSAKASRQPGAASGWATSTFTGAAVPFRAAGLRRRRLLVRIPPGTGAGAATGLDSVIGSTASTDGLGVNGRVAAHDAISCRSNVGVLGIGTRARGAGPRQLRFQPGNRHGLGANVDGHAQHRGASRSTATS